MCDEKPEYMDWDKVREHITDLFGTTCENKNGKSGKLLCQKRVMCR